MPVSLRLRSYIKSMGLIELAGISIESPDKDPKKNSEGTRVSLTEKGSKKSDSVEKRKENEWAITQKLKAAQTRRVLQLVRAQQE